jgi:hypothetical protein
MYACKKIFHRKKIIENNNKKKIYIIPNYEKFNSEENETEKENKTPSPYIGLFRRSEIFFL